jgi:DNA (cytosine-5)-methyltransferase 1
VKFIDLFAGIGGFHPALHNLGAKCIFASEIDKYARKTYEYNFKKHAPKLFNSGNFNKDINLIENPSRQIPNFDILTAGFPCQPFSQAGLKKGFADTRGILFFTMATIIKKNNRKLFSLKM